MIHVCFGLHDKTGHYAKFTGTAMLSLFDNTASNVTVHILHDNTLSADNRDKFIYLAGQYGQIVKFYNVEELCADKITKMIELVPSVKTSRVSVGTFYRLLIPQILPADIDKCIYLDSDMIINLDIAELWRVELGNKPLAAVPEGVCGTDTNILFLCTSGIVGHEEYFNSGVMLVNLNQLRKEENAIINGVKWHGEHPQCICFDQDVLNYCFAKNSLKLPPYFDVFVVHARTRKEPFGRKIYHYAGKIDSFTLDIQDDFYRLWMDYFIRTPFFDAETIGRLYTGFKRNYNQLYAEMKDFMIQLSAMMSGKTRAFFAAPADIEAIRKIFFVRPDEEIIPAEDNSSLQKLIDGMNASRGQKLFFIVLPNFPFQTLIQAGFVHGHDFVNGMYFLPDMKAATLDSYELIKAM